MGICTTNMMHICKVTTESFTFGFDVQNFKENANLHSNKLKSSYTHIQDMK